MQTLNVFIVLLQKTFVIRHFGSFTGAIISDLITDDGSLLLSDIWLLYIYRSH